MYKTDKLSNVIYYIVLLVFIEFVFFSVTNRFEITNVSGESFFILIGGYIWGMLTCFYQMKNNKFS